ncbi:hypothetical protein BGX29_005161 [Mortierella sp. GBA35]|nr:hypothetical protein BGX29_005161 [Mortierella sp. GBA35]
MPPPPPPPVSEESQHVVQQERTPPPPSYVSPPVQAPPQFPSSPWDDDDDDFYQAATPPPVIATVKAPSRKALEPVVHAPPNQALQQKETRKEPQPHQQQVQKETRKEPQPHQQQVQKHEKGKESQRQDHSKLKQPAQQPQPEPQPRPQKQEQSEAPVKTRKQSPTHLAPEQDRKTDEKHGTGSAPPMSPSPLSADTLFMARYPPPPPSILYSDDQITVSSLHLTIHSFYFPLNTPVTIPLLTITEMETLPSGTSSQTGGGSSGGGVASWLKYKNWGVSTALTDIWWARDYKPSIAAAAAASSQSADKENAPPLVYVVVRVEGEWLRKGFGVQQEQGVKVLKDAWKNVKEAERGLRPLRPATLGMEDDDGLVIEKPAGGQSLSVSSGGRVAAVSPSGGGRGDGGAEKRRWLNYHNSWTAYPFADDSPQFLAQQQRRGGASVLSSKAPRYHQQHPSLRPPKTTSTTTTATAGSVECLGPDEFCGDEPLFIDNDLNIHEEI